MVDLFPFLYFFCFLVYVFLGGWIIYRNPKSSLNRICCLMFGSFGLWSLSMVFIHNNAVAKETAGFFENIGALGWATFPTTFIIFTLIFIGKKEALKNKLILSLVFALPALFLYKQLTGALIVDYIRQPYGWAGVWSHSVWSLLYFAYYFSFVGILLFLIINFWRGQKDIAKRREAKIIFNATLVALILGSLTDVALPRLGIFVIPDLAPVITLIWAFGVAYSVAKYKFLTISPATAAEDIIATMTDALILLDKNGIVVTVNKAALGLLECSRHEILGKQAADFLGEDFQDRGILDAILKGNGIKDRDIALRTKKGKIVPVIFSSSVLWGEGTDIAGAVCIIRDITERKTAEEALKKAHHNLEDRIKERTADLMASNEKLQLEIAERRRIEKVLRESEAKYSTLVEKGNDQIVISQAGIIKYANNKMLGIMGLTLEKDLDKPFIDYVAPAYKKIALEMYEKRVQGYETPSTYELELIAKDGTTIPVEVSASLIEYEGRPASMAILRDITERKRAEKELKESYKKLEGIIENIIDTISTIVETRDPYTAGHQKRVAKLACAIAQEMGLEEEKIKGIRMAGMIHDIGKISVPGEILAKPGRLTKLEMDMIKAHCQMGYDILKNINFPWPIAQIVLQHHERMNGSGYPAGATDGEILLEAEILSAADVVEAMISHRPYRPALGLDKALEEISQKRGILYHPGAVDACVRLFREKNFSIE